MDDLLERAGRAQRCEANRRQPRIGVDGLVARRGVSKQRGGTRTCELSLTPTSRNECRFYIAGSEGLWPRFR